MKVPTLDHIYQSTLILYCILFAYFIPQAVWKFEGKGEGGASWLIQQNISTINNT